MKACAQERTGYVFDWNVVVRPDSTIAKKVAPRVADTPCLWANLFQWDYLLSRPLED